jgi:hypothetical protein
MPSLDETFDLLVEHLREPEKLNPARSDPFFYFVHAPEDTLTVKQKIAVWTSFLTNEGWTVERVSLCNLIWQIIDTSGRWEEWLGLEQHAEASEINEAIRDVLRTQNALIEALAQHVTRDRAHTVVLVTDMASMHPFSRARALESGLHDRVKTPTVLFYPGRRSGQYGLHFLDIYGFDGNYRATLLGGIE